METISRNIEDLVAFHNVALQGSFTRAAETMGTSKAMVSKQVKRLETYMKSRLFIRTTRTLNMTEQGIALYNYSQKIFNLSDEASRRLRDMSQGTSGIIRISVPVSMGELIMPSLLPKAKATLPNVRFEVDLSNDNRNFGKDGIDFAIRASESHHPDLIVRYLGRIKDVICASPDFLKKAKLGGDPKDLAFHQCILHSQEELWNTWTFSSKSKDVRVEVKGSFATNQYQMARIFGLSALGFIRVPLYLVANHIAQGTLVEVFAEYEISTHPLYLVYTRNEYATKKHKVMKELILQWFAAHKNFFLMKKDNPVE